MAAVKMSTELIGMCQLAEDWGRSMDAKLMLDSAAAIGTISRKGNGKMRHVRVGNLWIQQQVEDGEISIDKVKGEQNPADLMTNNM